MRLQDIINNCRDEDDTIFGCESNGMGSTIKSVIEAETTTSPRIANNPLSLTETTATKLEYVVSTVWELQKFSVIQILCEINCGDCKSSKMENTITIFRKK